MKKTKIITKKIIAFIVALPFISGVFMPAAFASSTDGTIDSTYKYAWGENIGWINFGTTEGNVHINDSAMTGYAWAENFGWIPLNCSNDNSCGAVNYKVSNNGNGTLSGYSWSADTGWVSFAPTNGGVTIDANGELAGYAWGENIGWMVLNCSTTNSCSTADYKVKTDWRPQNVRPQCNNTQDDDGDGKVDYSGGDSNCSSMDDNTELGDGGGAVIFTSRPTVGTSKPSPASEGEFVVLINNNTQKTNDRSVKLFLKGNTDTKSVWISENPNFPEGLTVPYNSPSVQVSFILSEDEGSKTVYANFCDSEGQCSGAISDNITFTRTNPIVKLPPSKTKPLTEESMTPAAEEGAQPPEELVEPTAETTIKPAAEPATGQDIEPGIETTAEPAVEPTVEPVTEPEPQEAQIPTGAPDAMQGEWELLKQQSISDFTLSPLPQDLTMFIEKFPDLQNTFNSMNISKLSDVESLKTVQFTLPSLTETIGLPKGIPVALIPAESKKSLPAEVVFAKTGNGYVDFNSTLNITDKGETRQKIASVSGKPLELVIKTDKPMESVTGYIVYKSKRIQNLSIESSHRLIASLFSTDPTSDEPTRKTGNIEERMVLQKFEYTDTDGDGIYTANINTPLVEGEYEIITVMDYKDPALGTKEIKLITVIDPEGYIYEKTGNKETRIPEAIVSLNWLNPETKAYELWPAEKYQQENPQTTDMRGVYSFLAPEGTYYIKVDAPGYLNHTGDPFDLRKDVGIHKNIALKNQYWWLGIFDWKTVLLIIIGILLLYNFYKDRMRDGMRDRIREKLVKNS